MAILRVSTVLAIMAAVTTGLSLPKLVVRAVEVPDGVKDVISVTMYQDTDWSGSSTSFSITTQTQCYGLSNGEWDNTISSIQIPSGYRCRFWDSNSCNGDSTPDIYAPGAYSLPNGMNDRATSFKCYVN
ncbi:hypothetical protein VSDG_07058 [Cytospora chrysosperma]|uniref:Ig-like domain-containing protein n=1 Tax=Cytospora chrysosperma TaxID=252740 RepID=A0A423VV27_CYTCH|nr:hypothetical protein VSDG_07058 [Valsa sordida]